MHTVLQKANTIRVRGFTLIELIVALAILGIAFVALFGAVQLAKRALRTAGDRSEAAFILEESQEAIRHIRDEGWDKRIKNVQMSASQTYCLDFGISNYGLTSRSAHIANFQLDEVLGVTTFVDTSASTTNGTCVGTTCPTAGVAGQFGSATRFDGIDDAITVTSAADPTEYTIEAWVKPSDTNTRNIMVRTSPSGPTVDYSHQLRTFGNKFMHLTNDGAIKLVAGNASYVAGSWYYVAATAKNNGMMRLYVNGVEDATPAAVGILTSVGDRYIIGGAAGFSFFTTPNYLGDIDAVSIFNRQFSSDEVLERFAAGPPCRIVDNKFLRITNFANACRNSTDQDIDSYSYGSGGAVCGTGGLVDADTKIATSTVTWPGFLESSAIYLPNLLRN